jgi:hypothetical protein
MKEVDKNKSNIKHLDKACDALAQACFEMAQTDDWVAAAALVPLEGILDDLCERVTELREIRDVVQRFSEENLR